uniref:Ig-like domain-containing protein n=1 Tax=Gouania willdenowi TaxID=441366 RepID=A0A8C5EF85_GOUWI
VQGSTVTLPCSFTPLTFIQDDGGRKVQLQVVRVVWCKNHEICQGETPSVYDSKSPQKPGFKYLGDMKSNCTLQISDVQKQHNSTFRFRMEVNFTKGHFTNKTGVNLTVIGKITKAALPRGHTLKLHCTSLCTFHQLKVKWYRNAHALPESGPALQLSSLTPEDSGNYTCALSTNEKTKSLPYRLKVEEQKGSSAGQSLFLILGVVFGLILILIFPLICWFGCRKRAAEDSKGEQGVTEQKVHVRNHIQIIFLLFNSSLSRLNSEIYLYISTFNPLTFKIKKQCDLSISSSLTLLNLNFYFNCLSFFFFFCQCLFWYCLNFFRL